MHRHDEPRARHTSDRDTLILRTRTLVHVRRNVGRRRTVRLADIRSCYLEEEDQPEWLVLAGMGIAGTVFAVQSGNHLIGLGAFLFTVLAGWIWHWTARLTLRVSAPGVRIELTESGRDQRSLRSFYRKLDAQIERFADGSSGSPRT